MDAPTFDDTPRPIPCGPTFEIRDAAGRSVSVGTILDGDFRILRDGEEVGWISSANARQVDSLNPLILSEPPAFTFTCHTFGSGDGRGGNARDRRKARRAGRLWRSLPDVVRDSGDASERAASLLAETMNRLCWEGGR